MIGGVGVSDAAVTVVILAATVGMLLCGCAVLDAVSDRLEQRRRGRRPSSPPRPRAVSPDPDPTERPHLVLLEGGWSA